MSKRNKPLMKKFRAMKSGTVSKELKKRVAKAAAKAGAKNLGRMLKKVVY